MKLITGGNEMKDRLEGSVSHGTFIYAKEKNVFPVMADAIYNTNGPGSYASIPV